QPAVFVPEEMLDQLGRGAFVGQSCQSSTATVGVPPEGQGQHTGKDCWNAECSHAALRSAPCLCELTSGFRTAAAGYLGGASPAISRISTDPPDNKLGHPLANSAASLIVAALMTEYPPTTSLDSANGPSETIFLALTTAPSGFRASPASTIQPLAKPSPI